MKITIDTTNKTIEVDNNISLGKLVAQLKDWDIEWEEYKLVTKVTVNNVNVPSPLTNPFKQPYWLGDPPDITVCKTLTDKTISGDIITLKSKIVDNT